MRLDESDDQYMTRNRKVTQAWQARVEPSVVTLVPGCGSSKVTQQQQV